MHSGIAMFLAVTLILPLNAAQLGAQSPKASGPRQRGGALSESRPAPPDGGWPRAFNLANGDSVLIYQPQIDSWQNQKHIVAWSAISYQPKGAQQPTYGAVKLEADTRVALNERLVNFSNLQITESNFPTLNRDQTKDLVSGLEQAISKSPAAQAAPGGGFVISLDRVLAGLDKSKIRPSSGDAIGIKSDPPEIFTSTTPAILALFDGEPIWSPIQNVNLKYAVNTNWDVFEDPGSKTFYLRNNDTWLKATDIKGPWSPAGKLPGGFNELPANDNWNDVKANLPGRQIAAGAVPKVFESYKPAELILLNGQPKYTPVKGTSLFWVNNTESDLFRQGKSGSFYYLVAGRWFSSPSLNGPWTFATTNLPSDFSRIPLDHPRSRVLASVPGTDQAVEAVLLASTPQTARVNRKELQAPDVAYAGGSAQFQPIEQTSLQRAVNTDKQIIKVGSQYYMLYQGVWFVSMSPNGPWQVTGSVPGEIYQIPPSSPAYNVTYVTAQEEGHNSDWVTFAALAGYTGMMIAWGAAVWGTGWYYPPFWGGGAFWGYPGTYGMGAWYNPHTGTYGRGIGGYGPYGGAGAWSSYNPRTGTYTRGAAAYGPYNSRAFAQAWNPRTDTYGQTRQGSNVYGNWGSSYVQRGDQWARTGHVTNAATGNTTGVARTSGGDVYADHNGNVYRKQDGSWEKYSNGGWQPAQKPNGNANNLGGQTRQGAQSSLNQPGNQPGNRPMNPTGNQPGRNIGGQTQQGMRQGLRPSGNPSGNPAAGSPTGGNIGGQNQFGTRQGFQPMNNQFGSPTMNQLDRDWSSRMQGAQRMQTTQSFQNFNANGFGGRQYGGSYQPRGGFGGGGFRGGGRRR
jgi:hypothetical protein